MLVGPSPSLHYGMIGTRAKVDTYFKFDNTADQFIKTTRASIYTQARLQTRLETSTLYISLIV